ncbi:MAG: hypothetical protein HY078_09580 [Elusimicrobia bacterium]|nr:hypothetical protein [Elusimicrobiota bacterium]
MDWTVEVNDLRGEYWLYREGSLAVDVGRGAMEEGDVFNTCDVHQTAGMTSDAATIARAIGRVMKSIGTRRCVLHLDGKWTLGEPEIAIIDAEVAGIGLRRRTPPGAAVVRWAP